MSINWSTQVPGPGGVLIPTYGNYGGPGYSDGKVLEDPNQPVAYETEPVDALDALFLEHDKAYDSLDPAVRAEGDVELAKGIAALSDQQLDAEASLYGGFATLFAIYLLVNVNQQPGLLSARDYFFLTQSALDDIERGVAQASPEERTEIATWLQRTADADVAAPIDVLLNTAQSFDFGNVAQEGQWKAGLLELVEQSADVLSVDEASVAVGDIREGLLTSGSDVAPADLQHWLGKYTHQATIHLDWLV